MSKLLEGRVALVTGGTVGIGQGIADVLADHGATVVVTGVTEAECATTREAGYDAVVLDVRDRAACDAVVKSVIDTHGSLSVLAANAGVYPQTPLRELSDDEIDFIFDVNVKGTIHMVQAAADALRDSERGRIVVTSSITGNYTGYPGWAHYGATKAAQLGFIRSAAMELAKQGTTINAVLPGNIVTPGLQALGEAYLAEMAKAVPLGKLGEPRDIGEAVAFLASDGARYITGQSIVVDGGQILPEGPDALEAM
ncbi:3-oxoacyl-ACP reductase FabG [Gulosibacter bifidus]|uniref:3-oxoacyl-ACP reductase FabG n=1 Tax=Gulosibacter bifidus TaxID=272239 RepID=A0ABW5RGH5_9MICO|nr:3-oxoacyl-ACP reductase FabG [Gulosibacter bifidus]